MPVEGVLSLDLLHETHGNVDSDVGKTLHQLDYDMTRDELIIVRINYLPEGFRLLLNFLMGTENKEYSEQILN